MSNNAILKKSVFGGFKKSDVLDYIEQLQSENCGLRNELENKMALLESADEVKEKYDSLKADYEALKSENDGLSAKAYESEKQAVQLSSEIAAKDEAIASLQAKQAEDENKYNKLVSEYKNASDEKSNAVIRDAVKYADSIVAAAKENAAQILARTGTAIEAVSADIVAADVRVKTAQTNLDYSLVSVRESVDSLLKELTKTTEELREES